MPVDPENIKAASALIVKFMKENNFFNEVSALGEEFCYCRWKDKSGKEWVVDDEGVITLLKAIAKHYKGSPADELDMGVQSLCSIGLDLKDKLNSIDLRKKFCKAFLSPEAYLILVDMNENFVLAMNELSENLQGKKHESSLKENEIIELFLPQLDRSTPLQKALQKGLVFFEENFVPEVLDLLKKVLGPHSTFVGEFEDNKNNVEKVARLIPSDFAPHVALTERGSAAELTARIAIGTQDPTYTVRTAHR